MIVQRLNGEKELHFPKTGGIFLLPGYVVVWHLSVMHSMVTVILLCLIRLLHKCTSTTVHLYMIILVILD